MLRGASGEKEPRHGVVGVVGNPVGEGDTSREDHREWRKCSHLPDEEGADGDEVGDGEPELPAVDVDAGAEGAERLGVLLLPALHELAQLLGVLGRVEHVHVKAAVAHLVVQVDGVGRGAVAEAHLEKEMHYSHHEDLGTEREKQ